MKKYLFVYLAIALVISFPIYPVFAKHASVKSATNPKEAPRDYYASTSSQEREDIAYIVRTLANTSLVKIMSHQSSLESAGDRVEHLHPLKFLMVIFTDEELKVCMHNLQGRSWVWKDFLEGVTTSLNDEAAAGNLREEYIKDFAKKIKVDIKLINPSLKKRNWEKFVDLLIEHSPRDGDPTRYDM